jgi:WD40 repeat protein
MGGRVVSDQPMINFAVHQARAGQSGASADFEQMLGLLVQAISGEANTVFANPGDWGIDVLVGDLRGRVTVWQAKYFIRGVGRGQWEQIRSSFGSALKAAADHGYTLERWVLCIPSSMDGPTLQRWQEWRADQQEKEGVAVGLWDETTLRELLLRPEAADVRRHYYNPYRFDASPTARGSPYRGLNAFGEADAGLFFGRNAATERVLGLMSAALGGCGLVVVSGVSGAGKSSLLRAGVLARIRESGLEAAPEAASWPSVVFMPGSSPLDELAVRIAPLTRTEAVATRDRLAADPASFALTARQTVATPAYGPGNAGPGDFGQRRVLLVVDQCEQLFTLCESQEQRQAFITALHAAASGPSPGALVVLAVRADFEARLADCPELATAVQDRYLLTAMAEWELQSAISEPARLAGSPVDRELVHALLEEARDRTTAQPSLGQQAAPGAGMLPLLSHALDQAWRIHTGLTVTLADYERTGGMEGAVAASAQHAYDQLTPARQDIVRQVFTRLTDVTGDGANIAVRAARADLTPPADPGRAADVTAVLETFAADRLLILDAATVEVSHEALLTAWPQLRSWLADTKAERVMRGRLNSAARDWEQSGRNADYLYGGSRLQAAMDTASRIDADPRHAQLSEPETEFLRASGRASRRRTRRRGAVLAVVCASALAAAAVGAYSVREQQDAAQHAATVYSTQLAADAQALQETDPGLAVQLAIAAYRYAPTEQAATQMYDSLNTPLDTVIGTAGSAVLSVAAQADGPLAAAIGHGGTLRVWNLYSPSSPVLDATIPARAAAIALSPDGRLLAGECPDRSVCLWNLANPRHPVVTWRWPMPSGVEMGFTSMAISPDGELLAAASNTGVTLVWSIGNPSRPRLVASLPNPTSRIGVTLAGVAFAPRGLVLADTILGGATRLWSVAHPTRPVLMATIKGGYSSIAFDPASSVLAAVGDGNIGLWQIRDLRHPEQLTVSEISVSPDLDMTAVTFSPDGTNLAFTGLDTYDTLSQVCTLRIPEELLYPGTVDPACTSTGFQSEAASYTSGDALLTGGPGGRVRLWRWPGHPADGILDEGLAPEQISPDGSLMASDVPSGSESTIDIWSLTGPAAPVLDAAIPVAGISMQQFLSAGVLLIADGDGRTRLWDLRDPRHPRPTASLGTAGTNAAESLGSAIGAESANHLAAIEGPDGQLNLWRITSPTRAIPVGSIPGTPGATGILVDGQTAFRLTGHDIQWWDITDPAHPVRRSISALPGTGSLDTAIAAGTLLVGTTTIDPGSGTADLVLFNVVRGRVRSSATLSAAAGTELDVSPDSHLLAVAGSGDDAVTLWDVSNPGRPRRLSTVSTQLGVSDIAFSPDSKVLAVAAEGTVQLWDIDNPEDPVPLGSITSLAGGDSDNASLTPSIEQAFGLAFTGQGDSLAITANYTTSLIDSDPAELAARLCRYAGVPISLAQWQQYAPSVPYQRPCP